MLLMLVLKLVLSRAQMGALRWTHITKEQGSLETFLMLATLPSSKALTQQETKVMVNYFACSETLPKPSCSSVLLPLQSPPCLCCSGQPCEGSPVDKEQAGGTERTSQCHQQNCPSPSTECSAEPEAWKYSAEETSNTQKEVICSQETTEQTSKHLILYQNKREIFIFFSSA